MRKIERNNRMRRPEFEGGECGGSNQSVRHSDSWVLMQPSVIYSILVGIWSGKNIIGISEQVRLQFGKGQLLDSDSQYLLAERSHLSIPSEVLAVGAPGDWKVSNPELMTISLMQVTTRQARGVQNDTVLLLVFSGVMYEFSQAAK